LTGKRRSASLSDITKSKESIIVKPVTKKQKKTKTLKNALEESKSQEVLAWMKDGTLIEVTNEYTLNSCLSVLTENKILSIPVKDVKTQNYIGFVDMVDIVTATVLTEETTGILKKLEDEDQQQEAKSPEKELKDVDREDTESSELEERFIMSNLNAKALSDISHRDSFISVNADDSVLKVAEILVKNHRVGVMKDGKLSGIITQSGLVEYITEEHAELYNKSISKKTVKNLNLPSKVYSVDEDERAIEAFKLMRDKGVSGLAVTGKVGELVDTISVSDILVWAEWILNGQSVRFSNLTSLRKSVKEFLQESRSQRSVAENRNLAIQKNSKVQEAVGNMQLNHVHRLFVVENSKAISVVNYNNIIEFLISK